MRLDGVLPRPFRQSQSAIRFSNELLSALPGCKGRHANADRDTNGIVTETVVYSPANALGNLRGGFKWGARHQNRKFLPSVTRTHVKDSRAAAEQFGNRPQGAVPFDVAECVVNRLKSSMSTISKHRGCC